MLVWSCKKKKLYLAIFNRHVSSVLPVSGEILSSIFSIASPCFCVHSRIGDPPPISAYCSWILGVRLFAINFAMYFWNGNFIISRSAKRLCKKSCTSSNVLGPPILVRSTAVGLNIKSMLVNICLQFLFLAHTAWAHRFRLLTIAQ